jgi:hypothetical protein
MHGCTHVPHWEGMYVVCHSWANRNRMNRVHGWAHVLHWEEMCSVCCSGANCQVFELRCTCNPATLLSSLRIQMCVQSSNTSAQSSNSDVRAIQQHFCPAFEFKCTYNPATLLHPLHPSIHLDPSSNTVPRLHATPFLLSTSSCADKTRFAIKPGESFSRWQPLMWLTSGQWVGTSRFRIPHSCSRQSYFRDPSSINRIHSEWPSCCSCSYLLPHHVRIRHDSP